VARYARPVPVGEEWRERSLAANVAAPRNNTVIGAGSPRDLTDRSGMSGTNAGAAAQRATPGRSRLSDAAPPPRSTAIDVPQIDVPTIDAPRASRTPSRAVMPRSGDPTAAPGEDQRNNDVQRAAPRVDPYASPVSPAGYGRSTGREPSRVPQGEPPTASPSRQQGPERAAPRSSGRPDPPSAGSASSSAPPPPSSQGPSRVAPSGAPPSSAAPPPAAGARSGGSTGPSAGSAGPRSRGGGQL